MSRRNPPRARSIRGSRCCAKNYPREIPKPISCRFMERGTSSLRKYGFHLLFLLLAIAAPAHAARASEPRHMAAAAPAKTASSADDLFQQALIKESAERDPA